MFQGQFGSCVLDEKHLAAAVRYVENNPVRAGMVRRAWEYPWSSAKFHVGEQKKDFLVKDRDLLGLVADWRGFLQADDSVGEKDLRRATKTGRPLVGHENLARIEKKTCPFARRRRRRKAPALRSGGNLGEPNILSRHFHPPRTAHNLGFEHARFSW